MRGLVYVKSGFILLCKHKHETRSSESQVMKKASGKKKTEGTAKPAVASPKSSSSKSKAPSKSTPPARKASGEEDIDEFMEEDDLDFNSYESGAGSFDDDDDDDF